MESLPSHIHRCRGLWQTVSIALFSRPGFDGIGSYIHKVIVQDEILICHWWRLSWRAQLGVKTKWFCWDSLRVRPWPHRAWGPPGALSLGELLPHLISCSISGGKNSRAIWKTPSSLTVGSFQTLLPSSNCFNILKENVSLWVVSYSL